MELKSTKILIALAGLYSLAVGLTSLGPGASAAQPDCQTIVTCRFTKGGSYRGCLSSYSCRQCTFVSARCQIGSTRGTCRKVQCTWGG